MEQHIRGLIEQIKNLNNIINPYTLRCWDFYTLEKMNLIQDLYKDIHKTIRNTNQISFPFPPLIATDMGKLSQQIENIESIIQPYRWLWGKDMYTNAQMYQIQSFFEEINRIINHIIHSVIVTEKENINANT